MPIDLAALDWRITNDGVMGGLSRSAAQVADGGLRFAGKLSRANGGGFASVLAALPEPLHPFAGVRLTVRGDGREYQLRLRADDDSRGIAWRAPFTAGPEPRRMSFLPEDFEPVYRGRVVAEAPPLDAVTIRHLGLMLAGGTAGPFELEVRDIEFVAPGNGARLVIGASRGIGLALAAAQLADRRVRRVVATHRAGSDPAGLEALRTEFGDRLETLELDVTDGNQLQRFAERLAGVDGGFDLAIHAAGILHGNGLQPEKSIRECRPDALTRMFEVNSIAPLMTAQALLQAQQRSRRFVFAAISAMVGSIGDNRLGGWYGYRASKAALNQFLRTLANECRLRHPRAAIVAIHPGTTDTDLSRPFQRGIEPGKLYRPATTAERILRVLEPLGPADSGRFFNWDGSEIPW